MNKLSVKILSLSSIAFGLLQAPLVQADSMGLIVGGGQWSLDYSGNIAQGIDVINLTTDLGLTDKNQTNYFVALEHPIPFLPNIKLQRQDADQTATSILTRSFDYSGSTFSINETIDTNLDLGYTDIILYYEILDNWVSLDLGVNVKYFDGNIDLSTATASVSDKLDDFIPMLYARTKFEIPATNFILDFEGSVLALSGDTLSDLKAALAYETDIGFGAELGYKRININVDNISDISANLSFEGYYFNATFHF